MRQPLQLAALIFTAALVATAQTSESRFYWHAANEWIQELHGSLPAAKAIKVISTVGAIRFQGAQQSNITYTARVHIRAGSERAARIALSRLKFSAGSGEVAWLRAECDGSNQRYTDFDIQAPTQTLLVTVETRGGAVTVSNISGKVNAKTGGGNVKLDQISGPIFASSGGGNIEIGNVGSDVKAETGGGSIRIDSASGQVTAKSRGGDLKIGTGKLMNLETGGGWIQVNKCEGRLNALSGGGSIDLNEVLGSAEVTTGGGSIRVGSVSGGIHAETGSGPIITTLSRGGVPLTESRFETSVGDITLYIPDGLAVTVRAAVEWGRSAGISSEFAGIKITKSGSYGPSEFYAEGSLNGGGPVLHVHTSTGSIAIKHKGRD